jgi:two-component system sensor histidine kinase RegB
VTTRGRGEGAGGLGLGLFIAKTLIERSGAQLTLTNAAPPASGAVVRIVWPRPSFERGARVSRRDSPQELLAGHSAAAENASYIKA